MAACRTDPQGNYVSWQAGWTLINITQYHVPLQHFCHNTTDTIYFALPRVTQAYAFYICEALGSYLPLPVTVEQVHFWHSLPAHYWPDTSELCEYLWTPITDANEEGTWVTHYINELAITSAWGDGEPYGLKYENCGTMYTINLLSDVDCFANFDCAVCEFPQHQIFSLLGTCERELRKIPLLLIKRRWEGLSSKATVNTTYTRRPVSGSG